MGCTPAPACVAVREQADALWPDRSRTSDGICASPKHTAANPTSDHELGNAVDLTHDPAHGVDTYWLADQLRIHGDPRIKYVISNGRIWNPSISPNWRTYSGSNRHDHHVHISIHASARNDARPWFPFIGDDDMTETQEQWLGRVHHFVEVEWPKEQQRIARIEEMLSAMVHGTQYTHPVHLAVTQIKTKLGA